MLSLQSFRILLAASMRRRHQHYAQHYHFLYRAQRVPLALLAAVLPPVSAPHMKRCAPFPIAASLTCVLAPTSAFFTWSSICPPQAAATAEAVSALGAQIEQFERAMAAAASPAERETAKVRCRDIAVLCSLLAVAVA